MNQKRVFNLAYVDAELRAKLTIQKFEKEFENATNAKNTPAKPAPAGQTNPAEGNVPQQPSLGG